MEIVRYFLLPLTLIVMSSIQLDAMKRLRELHETIQLKCCPLDESTIVSDEPIIVLPRIIKHSTFLSEYFQAHDSHASFYPIPVPVADHETLENVVACLRIIDYSDDVEKELLGYMHNLVVNYAPQARINLFKSAQKLEIQKLLDCIEAYPAYAADKALISLNQRINPIIQKAKAVFEKIIDKTDAAIIIDVDDTALSRIKRLGMVKLNGVLTAIPYLPALATVRELYKQLVEMGFKIFFLTARTEKLSEEATFFDVYDPTVQNLKDEGYDIFEQVICVPYETYLQMKEQANGDDALFVDLHARWKESERNKIAERFTIAGTLDDTKANLQGENVGHAVLIPSLQPSSKLI